LTSIKHQTMFPNYPKSFDFAFLTCKLGRRSFTWTILVFGLILAGRLETSAQISINSSTPVTQNFDGIGTTALPANWKVTNSFNLSSGITSGNTTVTHGAPPFSLAVGMAVTGTGIPAGATIASIINGTSYSLSVSATATNVAANLNYSNGNNVSWSNPGNLTSMRATNVTAGNATGQSYVYTAGVPVGTDKAVGIQTSATYTNPQSIMVHYRNTSAGIMSALSVSYNCERYRIATQAAQVDFFYSLDGSTWIAESSGNVTSAELPTGASAFTFATPLVVAKTATISSLSIPQNGDIYIRWNFNIVPTPTQAIAIDDISATATYPPCVAPTNSPTALTFPSVGTGQISGLFTTATGSPTGYLVVRYPNAATPTNPVDATVYTVGNSLGSGTVVSAGVATSFSATGLSISTPYDFYIYSFNSTGCAGGPTYRTTSPLFATQSTTGCPTFAATITINPAATPVDGSVYNNLTDALNILSGCAISQPTVIQLASNYVSTTETFPIKLGAITGASATNTITIRPASTATNRVITGNSPGAAILDIESGTWWRVDGRAGGTGTIKNLTIENTDNLNTLGGSVAIRFINGAQNNIVRFVNARSSNKALVGGVINFGQGTITQGNSNNTVTNCDVFASSTGELPHTGISSIGLNTANNANTISNNNIYNFFNVAGNSYGIYISDNNTNWTISGNSIYQTAARILTGGAVDRLFSGIGFSPTVFTTITGMQITGNFIGGSAPNCGGSAMVIQDNGTATLLMRAIFIQAGITTPTSIQGNTVRNIALTSSSTSNNQSLISAASGAFSIGNVTPNTLGSNTGTGSVTLTQTNGGSSRLSGILAGTGSGADAMTLSNNIIGSLSVSGSGNVGLAGIYVQGAVPTYTITGNQIGGNTAGSISNNSGSGADTWGIFSSAATLANTISGNTIQNINSGTGRMLGIRADGGVNTISGNTIRNCTSASTALTGCIGIWSATTVAGQTISSNTIHSLSSTDASANSTVQGIYYTGPTAGTNVIERNFVHSLSLSTSAIAGAVYGIRILAGVFPVDVQNNMVRLGINASGSGLTTGYSIFGIASASTGVLNFNFNSVFLGGNNVSGTTSNTLCLLSSSAGNTRSFRNNILYNARTGGSTGKHYCIQVGGTGLSPAGLTFNHNLYLTTGSNNFVGLYNGADQLALADMVSTIGLDANSVSCDPKFRTPNGNATTVDLHIQASSATLVENNGVAIPGITTDFDGQTRASLSPTDIGADAGNFVAQVGGCPAVWTGANSTAWNNSGNWNSGIVPVAGSIVTIPGGMPIPVVTGIQNALNLTIGSGQTISLDAASELRVKGNVSAGSNSAVTGTGKLVLDGTTTQTITGTLTVSNVDFANTTVGGVVVAPTATMNVTPTSASGSGLVTFLPNANLTTNNKFILKSNALSTAKVGPFPASASVTGQLTQERFLPIGSGGGGWYFIGSPFSGSNFTNFSDDFRVIGLPSGMPLQGGGIVSSPQPERATVFKFAEALHNVRTDTAQKIGWRIPGNENIVPGAGYRAFISYSTLKNSRLTNRGTLVSGDFVFPSLTRNEFSPCFPTTSTVNRLNCNESQRGWNLVANPYPCDVNWDAPSSPTPGFGWIKPATMGPGWYRWHSAASGYGVYTTGIYSGTTPAPANPNIIPSGQAFFVQLTAPGTYNANLELRETAKITGSSGQFLRTAGEQELLRINISTPMSTFGYDVVVRFMDNATDGFDRDLDLPMLGGNNTNIFVPLGQNNLSIASYPWTNATKFIPLSINYRSGFGDYKLSFSDVESIRQGKTIYLKDLLTQSIQEVVDGFVYNYQTTASDGILDNRFELLFVPNTVTSVKENLKGASLALVPNPSDAQESVSLLISGLDGTTGQLLVTDAAGRVLITKSIEVKTTGVTEYRLHEKLAAGIYMVKVTGRSRSMTTKLVIR